jgi:hypothetical protein
MIPKIVYVFWDGELPVYERACFENMRHTNPSFEFIHSLE